MTMDELEEIGVVPSAAEVTRITVGSLTSPLETVGTGETGETLDELRLRVEQLVAENAAMRPIVLRMAEARMCRDSVTMIESCPHCSLKRGGVHGYSGTHDETCVVSQARRLGV